MSGIDTKLSMLAEIAVNATNELFVSAMTMEKTLGRAAASWGRIFEHTSDYGEVDSKLCNEALLATHEAQKNLHAMSEAMGRVALKLSAVIDAATDEVKQ